MPLHHVQPRFLLHRYAGHLAKRNFCAAPSRPLHVIFFLTPVLYCSVSIDKAYPAAWYAFQIIVGSIFPMLLIAAAWVLYNLKRPSKVHIIMFTTLMWTCVGTFYRLLAKLRSLDRDRGTNLKCQNFFFSLVRTVWIWLDPFTTRRIIPPGTLINLPIPLVDSPLSPV